MSEPSKRVVKSIIRCYVSMSVGIMFFSELEGGDTPESIQRIIKIHIFWGSLALV